MVEPTPTPQAHQKPAPVHRLKKLMHKLTLHKSAPQPSPHRDSHEQKMKESVPVQQHKPETKHTPAPVEVKPKTEHKPAQRKSAEHKQETKPTPVTHKSLPKKPTQHSTPPQQIKPVPQPKSTTPIKQKMQELIPNLPTLPAPPPGALPMSIFAKTKQTPAPMPVAQKPTHPQPTPVLHKQTPHTPLHKPKVQPTPIHSRPAPHKLEVRHPQPAPKNQNLRLFYTTNQQHNLHPCHKNQ